MSQSSSTISVGIGFPGLLAILFIGLKLTHVIDWPWVWVLSPLWIMALVAVFFLALAGLLLAVAYKFK